MAKEQLHNWGRYILLAIVIVFSSGGWVFKVISNTTAIADVKRESVAADEKLIKSDAKLFEKVEKTRDDIIDLKLQYKDIEGLTTTINTSLRELKDGQKTSNKVQGEMRTDVAVISEKVKTLTKD